VILYARAIEMFGCRENILEKENEHKFLQLVDKMLNGFIELFSSRLLQQQVWS